MTTKYHKVYEKEIFMIIKNYAGGKIEYICAYMKEDEARNAAGKFMTYGVPVSLHSIKLIGEFVEEKTE